MKLKRMRKMIAVASVVIHSGAAMACSCLAKDAEIIGSTYPQIFVFEMKEKSTWEKFKLAMKGGASVDDERWNFTFLEQLKGELDSNSIRYLTTGPCPLYGGESGGKFLGYLNDARRPAVGLCNSVALEDDPKKLLVQIELVRKAIREPVQALLKEQLSDWKKLAGSEDLQYNKIQTLRKEPEVQLWVMDSGSSADTETTVNQFKSTVQRFTINCVEKTFVLGNLFYFSGPKATGKIVNAHTAQKVGMPSIKSSEQRHHVRDDQIATLLYKEICSPGHIDK